MNDIILKKSLAVFFAPLCLSIGFSLEYFLKFVGDVDEYGIPKNDSFGWLYNIFHKRDGLYDMPNWLFYVLVIIMSFFVVRFMFKILVKT
ncbi:hypothetical protein [Flavobacterium sp. GCM10023249]|uniref:hypothetical protein n=1 Tax=unclassified Flavobacterium TaxID=196869 RepID=UPI0036D4395D